MTFNEYLRQRAEDDTPLGDFARDAVADDNWPERGTHDDFQEYLLSVNAGNWTMEQFEIAYAEWERSQRLESM